MFAHLHDGAHQAGVTDQQGRAVTGHVRLLGQRVQHQQPTRVPVADPCVQQGGHALVDVGGGPGQRGVALVGGDHRTAGSRPSDDGAQLVGGQDVAVGVARGVQPHERRVGPRLGAARVDGDRHGPRQSCTDVIGGIGDLGDEYRVAGTHTEELRQPGHRLLGADGGDDTLHADIDHVARGRPVEDRAAHLLGAEDRRIAVGVGGLCQRLTHEVRGRIDGGPHGQVTDPALVGARAVLEGDEEVPGEVGQAQGARQRGHVGGSPAQPWSPLR